MTHDIAAAIAEAREAFQRLRGNAAGVVPAAVAGERLETPPPALLQNSTCCPWGDSTGVHTRPRRPRYYPGAPRRESTSARTADNFFRHGRSMAQELVCKLFGGTCLKGHRLLTGWSLVRIRPGEPNKSKRYSEMAAAKMMQNLAMATSMATASSPLGSPDLISFDCLWPPHHPPWKRGGNGREWR
jgi:hypothetical protein